MKKTSGINDLQQFIYDLNDDQTRDYIMRNSLARRTVTGSPKYSWRGTLAFHNETSDEMMKAIIKKKMFRGGKVDTIRLATLSYTYENHQIHYVSVVYDTKNRKVILFDSGYNLYLIGKNRMLSNTREVIKGLTVKHLVMEKKACRHSRYGVQLNGQRGVSVSADAFCQSWSLYFLICYAESNQDLSFFKRWCAIDPPFRQCFLFQMFILPVIQSTPWLLAKYHLTLVPLLQNTVMNRVWLRSKKN